MREVTPQELSDAELNPFAIQLLVESWKLQKRKPVAFLFDGVPIALGYDPVMLLENLRVAIHHLENPGAPIPQAWLDNLRAAIARNT